VNFLFLSTVPVLLQDAKYTKTVVFQKQKTAIRNIHRIIWPFMRAFLFLKESRLKIKKNQLKRKTHKTVRFFWA
jgi:hypothetical protein